MVHLSKEKYEGNDKSFTQRLTRFVAELETLDDVAHSLATVHKISIFLVNLTVKDV